MCARITQGRYEPRFHNVWELFGKDGQPKDTTGCNADGVPAAPWEGAEQSA
jgi:hypothetical protein